MASRDEWPWVVDRPHGCGCMVCLGVVDSLPKTAPGWCMAHRLHTGIDQTVTLNGVWTIVRVLQTDRLHPEGTHIAWPHGGGKAIAVGSLDWCRRKCDEYELEWQQKLDYMVRLRRETARMYETPEVPASMTGRRAMSFGRDDE